MTKHNVFTLLVTYHRETTTYVDRDLYKNVLIIALYVRANTGNNLLALSLGDISGGGG